MSALDVIRNSGLFDPCFYLSKYLDVAAANAEPIQHFCAFGWMEGRWPNSWFDTAWYLETNADVRSAGENPLLHFIRFGEAEGRRPSVHFDSKWYADTQEIELSGALRHFLRHRTDGKTVPSRELYPVLHMRRYHLDPKDGIDPFLRYLEIAEREGLAGTPDESVIADAGIFDANYYLINGTDVYRQSLDPIGHFCRYGWREGRRPSLYFDTNWYLSSNLSVKRTGINPLSHYILEGEKAGRRPVVFFDPLWYRKQYEVPPEASALGHYLANRRNLRVSPNPFFDVDWYVDRMRLGPSRDPFAHYLIHGTTRDIDPSPAFNAFEYRNRKLGRPTRHFPGSVSPSRQNPLVHWLHSTYV